MKSFEGDSVTTCFVWPVLEQLESFLDTAVRCYLREDQEECVGRVAVLLGSLIRRRTRELDESLLKCACLLTSFGINEAVTGDTSFSMNLTYPEIVASAPIGPLVWVLQTRAAAQDQEIAAEMEELAQIEGFGDGFTFHVF
jgi:hypothetical protein